MVKISVMEKEKQQQGIMEIPQWWTCPEGHEELQKAAHVLGEKELLPCARFRSREKVSTRKFT